MNQQGTGVRCWVAPVRTPNTQHPAPEHLSPGFTLIELLLAMTLLAVISGGMAMAFSTSLRAAGAIRQRAEVADEQRKLVEQLREDLQGVWLRPGSQTTWFRGGDQSATATAGPGGATATQGDTLELTTARPISSDALQSEGQTEGTLGPQSDVAQVSWRLEPDADGTLALVRRERTPADPEVDDTQDPSVVRTVMSRSVSAMRVFCFDGTQWVEAWDAAAQEDSSTGGTSSGSTPSGSGQNGEMGLPQAVEVRLEFGNPSTNRRGVTPNQSSDTAPRLNIVVAMPGAEGQTSQQGVVGGNG
jgi:prepilin-type N-terminal cleavage/methylation domain-containing protein